MRVKRMVRASLVAIPVLAAVAVAFPTAMARESPTASPDALAVAAADRATSTGTGELAKGPDESFVRGDSVAGAGGLHYIPYERTYRGIPVIGGDAVVVTDSRGQVLSMSSAVSHPMAMPSTAGTVRADDAAGTARSMAAGAAGRGAPRPGVPGPDDTAPPALQSVGDR